MLPDFPLAVSFWFGNTFIAFRAAMSSLWCSLKVYFLRVNYFYAIALNLQCSMAAFKAPRAISMLVSCIL
jgi:hypothetical protein